MEWNSAENVTHMSANDAFGGHHDAVRTYSIELVRETREAEDSSPLKLARGVGGGRHDPSQGSLVEIYLSYGCDTGV